MAVMDVYSIPNILHSKLNTTIVDMTEYGGVITIRPVVQKKETSGNNGARGFMLKYGEPKLTVDKFLKMMREDKEMFEND